MVEKVFVLESFCYCNVKMENKNVSSTEVERKSEVPWEGHMRYGWQVKSSWMSVQKREIETSSRDKGSVMVDLCSVENKSSPCNSKADLISLGKRKQVENRVAANPER